MALWRSRVRIPLGPLEKIGSDPETAQELSWAVLLFVAARRGSIFFHSTARTLRIPVNDIMTLTECVSTGYCRQGRSARA
jgi:hypothetical protein